MENTKKGFVVGRARGSCLGGLALLLILLTAQPVAASSLAYVRRGDGKLAVIDTATHTVVDTVTITMKAYLNGLAITPDGAYVYIIGNVNPGYVWVLDTATRTVVDTIVVGNRPVDVAITPDGAFVYVTSYDVHKLSIIDAATHRLVDEVAVRYPSGLAITPDGAYTYVASTDGPPKSFEGHLIVIDTATHDRVDSIGVGVGQHPQHLAFTPDGTFAYAITVSTLAVIDTAKRRMIASPSLGKVRNPIEVAIHPDGAHAYIADASGSTILVFDTATHTLVNSVRLLDPVRMAFTPDGSYLYVTQPLLNTVSVLDPETLEVVATIPVAPGPGNIVMTP
ncbi:MAG: hypothetical protein HYR55_20595 [Acidobacteria bacterium]|nr:hypothetical protein [Acidobacteriota bacterium]MBI3658629.1 hypothetical protein [Acidobacteriota bacterium]